MTGSELDQRVQRLAALSNESASLLDVVKQPSPRRIPRKVGGRFQIYVGYAAIAMLAGIMIAVSQLTGRHAVEFSGMYLAPALSGVVVVFISLFSLVERQRQELAEMQQRLQELMDRCEKSEPK